MTADVSAVEQAFADLEEAPEDLQALLRPVLVRALQDPALMRQLASAALSQHLSVLGRVLTSLPVEGFGPPVPPLKMFLQFTIGEDVEDAEEAFDFVRTLDAPLRVKVEGGITRALRTRSSRSGQGTISLLALARLLALAFGNTPFVTHLLNGGEAEPFLPRATSDKPSVLDQRTSEGDALTRLQSTRDADDARAPSPLESFLGRFVEVMLTANEQSSDSGQLFVAIGRVIDITPNYVILEALRGQNPRASAGKTFLLGMARVVAMRVVSQDAT